MAAEPINIFSRKVDPAGVLAVLRKLDPGVRADGEGDAWRNATVTVRRGVLRKTLTLRFGNDPGYYAGDDWLRQMSGMMGYFSRFPAGDRADAVARTIASFRFALATFFEPDRSSAGDDDPRMRFVYEVAQHLDGVIFTPSGLRDAAGRSLVLANGEQDPEARFPEVPPSLRPAAAGSDDGGTGTRGGDEDGKPQYVPPTADRVARRCLALAAVSARGLLEQEEPADPGVEDTRRRLLAWIEDVGIGDELEPDEWKALQRPHRQLTQQEALNATWRIEGLSVLAWALNRHDLLPIDELVEPDKLLPAVGLLNAERSKALVADPPLRPLDELQELRRRLLAVHWRLRDFRLRPKPMNFREFARTAWFGPLDVEGLRLIDDDLAIGEHALAEASPERVGAAQSAATERHHAINWLNGESPRYADVETHT